MLLKTTKILLSGALMMTLANCSSSTTTSASLTTSLNQAVSYMEESLPDVNDTSSVVLISDRQIGAFALQTDLSVAWDSGTASDRVTMPGGMGGCSGSEPTYDGAVLNPAVPVTIKDYIGMSLDPNFQRCSSGGGASDTYKPTIFGRLSGAIEIIGYLDNFLPRNGSGVYTNGQGTANITVEGNAITVYYDVQDAAVTTYYDKSVGVRGYLNGDLNQQVFANLMWIRNDSTNLNFMFMEFGDNFDGSGSNGSDGEIDSTSYTVMAYNKSTGEMAFEYVSDSASAGTTGTPPTNPNMEIFRFYVAGQGQEGQILSFSGDSLDSGTNYMAFSVYGPNGDASTSASVS